MILSEHMNTRHSNLCLEYLQYGCGPPLVLLPLHEEVQGFEAVLGPVSDVDFSDDVFTNKFVSQILIQ